MAQTEAPEKSDLEILEEGMLKLLTEALGEPRAQKFMSLLVDYTSKRQIHTIEYLRANDLQGVYDSLFEIIESHGHDEAGVTIPLKFLSN